MRGNWIQMSATAAQANSATTAMTAITNFPTYSDWFGTSGTLYDAAYILDDGAGHYEEGACDIDLSTLTISARRPMSTYDVGATPKGVKAGAVRLTSFTGTVTVRCGPAARMLAGGESRWMKSTTAGNGGAVGNGYCISRADVTEVTNLQGWRNFTPFLWTGERPIVACNLVVTRAAVFSAGGTYNTRVGMMEIRPDGSLALVQEFTSTTQFDLTSAVVQTISNFSPLWLPQGPYVLQFVAYSTGSVTTQPQVAGTGSYWADRCSVFPRHSTGRAVNNFLDSAGATTLATTYTATSQYGGGSFTPITVPDFTFAMA